MCIKAKFSHVGLCILNEVIVCLRTCENSSSLHISFSPPEFNLRLVLKLVDGSEEVWKDTRDRADATSTLADYLFVPSLFHKDELFTT